MSEGQTNSQIQNNNHKVIADMSHNSNMTSENRTVTENKIGVADRQNYDGLVVSNERQHVIDMKMIDATRDKQVQLANSQTDHSLFATQLANNRLSDVNQDYRSAKQNLPLLQAEEADLIQETSSKFLNDGSWNGTRTCLCLAAFFTFGATLLIIIGVEIYRCTSKKKYQQKVARLKVVQIQIQGCQSAIQSYDLMISNSMGAKVSPRGEQNFGMMVGAGPQMQNNYANENVQMMARTMYSQQQPQVVYQNQGMMNPMMMQQPMMMPQQMMQPMQYQQMSPSNNGMRVG